MNILKSAKTKEALFLKPALRTLNEHDTRVLSFPLFTLPFSFSPTPILLYNS